MKLSMIIPCYNEEGNILPLYQAVTAAFANRTFSYELIFINDGSRDRTGEVLADLVKTSEVPMKVINFSRNFGKESGIYAGLEHADGDYISIMDGDLQQNPKILLQMVDYLDSNEECDCVAAYQENRGESRLMVFLKEGFYRVINRISDIPFQADASEFRTFRRSVAEALLQLPEYYRFSKGLFAWVGFNTHFIPYEADERLSGTTKWSFRRLWSYAFEGILSFSTKPLEWPFFGGLLLTAAGALQYGIGAAKQKERRRTEGLIGLVGGLNLTATGIAGIYLAKTYVQGKGRPVYLAKSILTNQKEQ
ncbi:MAG: glycosyltransferase family 2 protein [Oscillospiraceae bacterium]|nr:glycosyltransferase family 2 protein [Oscillospiraceae bacterium]